jgi:hypothetical protein
MLNRLIPCSASGTLSPVRAQYDNQVRSASSQCAELFSSIVEEFSLLFISIFAIMNSNNQSKFRIFKLLDDCVNELIRSSLFLRCDKYLIA